MNPYPGRPPPLRGARHGQVLRHPHRPAPLGPGRARGHGQEAQADPPGGGPDPRQRRSDPGHRGRAARGGEEGQGAGREHRLGGRLEPRRLPHPEPALRRRVQDRGRHQVRGRERPAAVGHRRRDRRLPDPAHDAGGRVDAARHGVAEGAPGGPHPGLRACRARALRGRARHHRALQRGPRHGHAPSGERAGPRAGRRRLDLRGRGRRRQAARDALDPLRGRPWRSPPRPRERRRRRARSRRRPPRLRRPTPRSRRPAARAPRRASAASSRARSAARPPTTRSRACS